MPVGMVPAHQREEAPDRTFWGIERTERVSQKEETEWPAKI